MRRTICVIIAMIVCACATTLSAHPGHDDPADASAAPADSTVEITVRADISVDGQRVDFSGSYTLPVRR